MNLIQYFIEQIQSLETRMSETRDKMYSTPCEKCDLKNIYRSRYDTQYGELRAYKTALLEVTASYVRGL